MGARLRSWWQKIKQYPFKATGIIIVILTLFVFIFSAYRFGWSATGFLNKTLWDWLQLLIIPLALAIIALVFQLANSRTERQIAKERYEQDKEIASRHYHQDQQIAKQRYEQDQQIALDKQREDLLQAYLDRISELLLKEKLRSSEVDAEVRNVARVRTITVLTQLDARRVGYVFRFLHEAGLNSATSNDNAVSLAGADLSAVNWRQANLWQANLSKANLSKANLSEANFMEANLSGAILYKANLREAEFSEANLTGALFSEANLSEAIFIGADLSRANLRAANLSGADFHKANLSEAFLNNANLKDAVDITVKELIKQAASLKDATMPDGSTHP